jgi:hypothetical protein
MVLTMLRTIWQRFVTCRYTETLEADVARLRAENRALLNSILGIAGVPPITLAPSDAASISGSSPAADAQKDATRTAAATSSNGITPSGRRSQITPMRRRSWQQINRMLELESAKKKSQ